MQMKLFPLSAVIALVGLSGCSPCDNETVSELIDPSGKLKAVVFVRGCGATTGFVTSVSILNVRDALANDPGNVFNESDSSHVFPLTKQGALDMRVKWDGPNRLIISYPSDESPREYQTFKGVVVKYESRRDAREDRKR
jgi:hypothetical protein